MNIDFETEFVKQGFEGYSIDGIIRELNARKKIETLNQEYYDNFIKYVVRRSLESSASN